MCLRPMEGSSGTVEMWTAGLVGETTKLPRGDMKALLALRLDNSGSYTIFRKTSLSSIPDPWSWRGQHEITMHPIDRKSPSACLLVSELGWSTEKAAEIYLRLRHFEEDWDAPGMDAYDGL